MKPLVLISIIALLQIKLKAQEIENKSTLKLSEIMKGNEFIGHQPERIRWTRDSETILFNWNPNNTPGSLEYGYKINSSKPFEINPEFYSTNTDRFLNDTRFSKREFYLKNGALYSYDIVTKSSVLILKLSERIKNLIRVQDRSLVYFQINNNVYKYDAEKKSIEIVIQFKNKSEPKELPSTLLEQEELELFQFHQKNELKEEWTNTQDEIWNDQTPTIYCKGQGVSNIQITPNMKFFTFRFDDYAPSKNTHVEHHISSDGHTFTRNARKKVSDDDATHKLGVYCVENDSVYFVNFNKLTNIRKKPNYFRDYGDTTEVFDADRKIIMHNIQFSFDGTQNVFDIRSYDNKDRWIVSLDFETGKLRELEQQHDEAWIGGPGISGWNMGTGTLGWLHDNETIYFQSEETGFSHLYTLNLKSNQKTALTSGKWEVHDSRLNKSGTTFYITANKTHPGNREFYHLNIDKGELIPILVGPGNYEVNVSPDEKQLAVRYSSSAQPWELYVAKNKPNTQLKKITNSTTKKFNAYNWYSPAVITFKSREGTNIHARLYSPEQTNANGAAIIFVHGAGYLQNAHNFWSGYYREYMFHNLLRDNGYSIIDIDYSASKGYGRDHRTSIYRHMGGKDLSDQLDGRKLLIDSLGIDPNRIGIYGGSYGGFITLMALLTEPGKFKAGAALRSVTDWSHYNHEYTSNILNYPGTDPEAYKKSSPIYFAENLEDRLIMLHGMVDDNVQFQDVVRLSQRFIELGKENWELAVYPVEAHGFKASSSWLDEYRRIYELFQEELIKSNE
ncbi:prolyl oligopeptidase family serine peptidase [Crocinitomicaceae bacterium]|nr:prolyl oligopeptidase family serine peptidase [Crocinitomicaceae bacterium]